MEIWEPLQNFPGYNGSSEGRIMNVRTQRILKTYVNDRGYERVCLRRDNQQYNVGVHRVIAETFLGDHPDLDVRHRDNNRSNNRVDNLYWSNRKNTVNDAFERGTRKPARQTAIRVVETGEVYDSVVSCANDLNCCRSDIFKCMAGTLPHVKGYHFERI